MYTLHIHLSPLLQPNLSFSSSRGLSEGAKKNDSLFTALYQYSLGAVHRRGKVLVRVDVTEEFPFLVTKMSPYYDR